MRQLGVLERFKLNYPITAHSVVFLLNNVKKFMSAGVRELAIYSLMVATVVLENVRY